MNGDYLSHLRFADNVVMLSESAERLQKMLQDLVRKLGHWIKDKYYE